MTVQEWAQNVVIRGDTERCWGDPAVIDSAKLSTG